MGIPSYFSYIIRTYSNIIRKDCERVQLLLMDCNSIVYDSYRELQLEYEKTPFDLATIEDRLIQTTIHKICEYIQFISPEKLAYITFDGVAPIAKMEQQRTRRYKSNKSRKETEIWNTTNITPGTPFMVKLSVRINNYFSPFRIEDAQSNRSNPFITAVEGGILNENWCKMQYKTKIKIMTSCSDEPGEGEHKLFQYIRDTDCKDDVVAVYGLDADLIMLSIFHTQFVRNIYVFRETPNFKTVLSSEYATGQCVFMDINALFNCIFKEMGNYDPLYKKIRVHDYIFMCFLLGNDFLPHFPSINIRIHGIHIIMDTYYQIIGKYNDRSLIDPITKKIAWNHVKIFLTGLSKNEHYNIKRETADRDKWDQRKWPTKTEQDIDQLNLNSPMIYRMDEKYICPSEPGWENRYYKRLFGIQPNKEVIEKISINYLEGLEWVYKYYTSGCASWKWKYNYQYPPLLIDLVKSIPTGKKDFVDDLSRPLSVERQLKYIMNWKCNGIRCAYSRYMWESHPILEEIDMNII